VKKDDFNNVINKCKETAHCTSCENLKLCIKLCFNENSIDILDLNSFDDLTNNQKNKICALKGDE